MNQAFARHIKRTLKRRSKHDLCRSGHFCDNSRVAFRPSRKFMPQFETWQDIERFDRLAGVAVSTEYVKVAQIHPFQRNIDRRIVNYLLNKWRAQGVEQSLAEEMPIMVDRHNTVLDGHHRWATLKKLISSRYLPADFKVAVRKYEAPAEQLIFIAMNNGFDLGYTYRAASK
jgi:hypothetical protein